MADNNGFDFDEESSGFDSHGDEGGFNFDEPLPEDEGKKPGKKKKSSSTLLLLLLLLVVVGAGAYYYFFMLPEPSPPPAPPKVAKKQPIAIPPRPAPPEAKKAPEPAAAENAQPVAPVAEPKTESAEKQAVAAPSEESKTAAAKPAETAPAVAKKAEEKPAPIEAAKAEPKPVPAPAPAVAPASVPAPVAEAPPVEAAKTSTPSSGILYTVQAGAFTHNNTLEQARKMVEKLGYEPKVKAVQRQVEMIRLRLGAFFPPEGREKLQEVLPVAPDAFAVQKGELMVIYVASFQNPRLAARFSESLQQKGLHVDEERSPVDVQMMLLSFGEFADKAEAQKAASAAKKAGLDTMVTRIKK